MKRSLVLLFTATAVVGALAPSARAGGSWLEVRDVDGAGAPSSSPWDGWAAPGATVTMRGTFSSGSQAPVSAGPWDAYLAGPGNELIHLAPVEIDPAAGNYGSHVASVTFVVPSIASGEYYVSVCADPRCDIGGVGDLVGGFFTIAATSTEARALNKLSILRAELLQSRRDEKRLRRRVTSLKLEVDRANDARRVAEAAAATQAATANDLATRRDDLARQLASARSTERTWRAIAILSIALLGAAATGLTVRRRRRSPRVVVPDTPEALVGAMPPVDRPT